MYYGIDLSVQIENIMPAVGLGFVMGFAYDIVRFIRLNFSKGKYLLFITDMLYIVACTLSSFLLYLAVNFGHIRAYLVVAELLGFGVYRCSLGIFIYRLFVGLSKGLRHVFRILTAPVRYFFGVIGSIFHKIGKKSEKHLKKMQNKLKNLLQRRSKMLYNNNHME
ncbi:MAG: spore cortex biosynthesis protein YabQ [Clostridiales bacterium]|nr:spore cortex biosynthesis protein YabQ [Clostridiales bacterium]